MTPKTPRKVPLGSRLFPDRPLLPPEEIARRHAEDKEFNRRCDEIFNRVYPELAKKHYDWFIHIEPESGDYFIDPDEKISFQKAKKKHPHAVLMSMRLNETGTVGKI